jgi:hypothetical protein|eukprot:COSAG01_NODE_1520_length_10029_cov_26.551374_4_plen_57_part_00
MHVRVAAFPFDISALDCSNPSSVPKLLESWTGVLFFICVTHNEVAHTTAMNRVVPR